MVMKLEDMCQKLQHSSYCINKVLKSFTEFVFLR